MEPLPSCLKDARSKLKQYIAQREERLASLDLVLQDNGIVISNTSTCLDEMMRLLASASVQDECESEFSWRFINFLWNIGQFVGDVLIERSPPKINKWTAEIVSPKGSTERFDFSVSGYAGRSQSFFPDSYLLSIARAVREGVSFEPSFLPQKLNFILDISARQAASRKNSSEQGHHNAKARLFTIGS